MPSYDLEKFVNREKELTLVREKIARLSNGEPFAPHERVIHFVGPSGIGKSFLLEKIYAFLTKEAECAPVLIKLDQFRKNREELVGEFLADVYQEFCKYQELSINTILKKPSESLRQYSLMVVRAINLSALDRTLVLLLDEISVLQREELQSIEQLLLGELLSKNSRFVLITAGRSPVSWNDFSLRRGLSNISPLPVFDAETISKQLESLIPGSGKLAGKVLELGNGVPGNTAKLVGHIVGDPLTIPNELQAVQDLVKDVKIGIEKHLHPIIEAICVLPDFLPDELAPLLQNHPALGEQWNEASIKEMFRELKQVQIGPGGLIHWDKEQKSWVMDDPTRALFERELQMRVPDLWRRLHCAANRMYEKWGDEFDSQLYRDKAAYHLERLRSAGMDCKDLEG